MPQLIEKDITRWLGLSLGIIILTSLAGLAATLIMVFDWHPNLIFTATGIKTGIYIGAGVLVLAYLVGKFWLIRALIALWREIFPSPTHQRFSNSFWLLFLPLLGEIYLTVLLVILSIKCSRWTLLLAMITAGGLIITLLTAQKNAPGLFTNYHPLADNPPFDGELLSLHYFFILITTLGYLLLIPLVAHVKYSRWLRRIGIFTAIFVMGIYLFNNYALDYLDARLVPIATALAQHRVPLNIEDFKRRYVATTPTNLQWTNLVNDEKNDNENALLAKLTLLENWRNFTADELQSFAEQLDPTLIAELDKLFATAPLRYDLDCAKANNVLCIREPSFNLFRIVQWYATRMFLAQARGDDQEFMRLYRLLNKVQLTATTEPLFFISAISAIENERTKLFAINRILGTDILSAAALDEITNDLFTIEKSLPEILLNGLRNEVAIVEVLTELGSPLRNPHTAMFYGYLKNDQLFFLKFWLTFFQKIEEYIAAPTPLTKNVALFAHEYCQELATTIDAMREIKLFTAMLLPPLKRIWQSTLIVQSQARMLTIAILIEKFRRQHGRLPVDLAELNAPLPLDIFSGENFKYRYGEIPTYLPNGEVSGKINGYQLYSVGENKIDDGGKIDDLENNDIIITVEIK